MVTFTINIPQMLAYIPAPWILWVMENKGFVFGVFRQHCMISCCRVHLYSHLDAVFEGAGFNWLVPFSAFFGAKNYQCERLANSCNHWRVSEKMVHLKLLTCWLVVWNMNCIFPISWEFHHPN